MHGQQNIKNCIDCSKLLWYYAISNDEKLLNKFVKGHVALKFRVDLQVKDIKIFRKGIIYLPFATT